MGLLKEMPPKMPYLIENISVVFQQEHQLRLWFY